MLQWCASLSSCPRAREPIRRVLHPCGCYRTLTAICIASTPLPVDLCSVLQRTSRHVHIGIMDHLPSIMLMLMLACSQLHLEALNQHFKSSVPLVFSGRSPTNITAIISLEPVLGNSFPLITKCTRTKCRPTAIVIEKGICYFCSRMQRQ